MLNIGPTLARRLLVLMIAASFGVSDSYGQEMATPVVVIRQDFDDDAVPSRLNTTFSFFECAGKNRIVLTRKARKTVSMVELTPSDIEGY